MAGVLLQSSILSVPSVGQSSTSLKGCRKSRRAAHARTTFPSSNSSSSRGLNSSFAGMRRATAVDAIGQKSVRSLHAAVAASVNNSAASGHRGVVTAMFERFTEKVREDSTSEIPTPGRSEIWSLQASRIREGDGICMAEPWISDENMANWQDWSMLVLQSFYLTILCRSVVVGVISVHVVSCVMEDD